MSCWVINEIYKTNKSVVLVQKKLKCCYSLDKITFCHFFSSGQNGIRHQHLRFSFKTKLFSLLLHMAENSQQYRLGQSLINTVLLIHAVDGGCLNSLLYDSYQKKKEIKFYGHRDYLQRVFSKGREVKWTTLFIYKMYKCYLLIKFIFNRPYKSQKYNKWKISSSSI